MSAPPASHLLAVGVVRAWRVFLLVARPTAPAAAPGYILLLLLALKNPDHPPEPRLAPKRPVRRRSMPMSPRRRPGGSGSISICRPLYHPVDPKRKPAFAARTGVVKMRRLRRHIAPGTEKKRR